MKSITLFIFSNRFYKTQNSFGPLNDHIIMKFSWVVTMAPAVPSTDILRWPVTSQWTSSRRLIFVISDNTKLILGLVIWTSGEDDTHRIVWLVLGAISCVTWPIYRSHRREATVRTFLPRLLTAASRMQNCTYRKMITYQTPQSNLPSICETYS